LDVLKITTMNFCWQQNLSLFQKIFESRRNLFRNTSAFRYKALFSSQDISNSKKNFKREFIE